MMLYTWCIYGPLRCPLCLKHPCRTLFLQCLSTLFFVKISSFCEQQGIKGALFCDIEVNIFQVSIVDYYWDAAKMSSPIYFSINTNVAVNIKPFLRIFLDYCGQIKTYFTNLHRKLIMFNAVNKRITILLFKSLKTRITAVINIISNANNFEHVKFESHEFLIMIYF